MRWKAAVGWPVTASAFHPTTLTYWRRRLSASAEPNRILAVQELVEQSGALKGRTARALDSTIVDDAVSTQDCRKYAQNDIATSCTAPSVPTAERCTQRCGLMATGLRVKVVADDRREVARLAGWTYWAFVETTARWGTGMPVVQGRIWPNWTSSP